ncbi:unnamed protein product, partial [Polarella glacialis]
DVEVSFQFNEKVSYNSGDESIARTITLLKLGGDAADRSADIKVADISMDSELVTLDGKLMTVKLEGLLEHSKEYSLSLPFAVMVDSYGNEFQGLPSGVYAFQTIEAETVGILDTTATDSFNFKVLLVAGVGGGIIGVFLLVAMVVMCKLRCMRQRAKIRADQIAARKLGQKDPMDPQGDEDFQDDDVINDVGLEWTTCGSLSGLDSPHSPKSFASPRSQFNLPSPNGSMETTSSSNWFRREGKPKIQVTLKDEDPRVAIRMEMRKTGSVASLIDSANTSAHMMKTMNPQADDKRLRRAGSGSMSPKGGVRVPSEGRTAKMHGVKEFLKANSEVNGGRRHSSGEVKQGWPSSPQGPGSPKVAGSSPTSPKPQAPPRLA